MERPCAKVATWPHQPSIHTQSCPPGPLLVMVEGSLTSEVAVGEDARPGSARVSCQPQCHDQRRQLRAIAGLTTARESTVELPQVGRVVDSHAPACSSPWPTILNARAICEDVHASAPVFHLLSIQFCQRLRHEVPHQVPVALPACPRACRSAQRKWWWDDHIRWHWVVGLSPRRPNRISHSPGGQAVILCRENSARELRTPSLPHVVRLDRQDQQVIQVSVGRKKIRRSEDCYNL